MKSVGCIGLIVILMATQGCDNASDSKKAIASAITSDKLPTPEKLPAAAKSPEEGRDVPTVAAISQEPEAPEVSYQRKRSELYDLVASADEALDNMRHLENFARTFRRLSQFNANLSPEAEKNLVEVADRVNDYLTTLLTYNHAVSVRALAVMRMEEELASGVMKGALPAEKVKSAYQEILAGFGQIGAFAWQDFSEYQGAMWNFFTGWELHHWDWAAGANVHDWGGGIQTPGMPKTSTDEWAKNMCSREDWTGAVFAVGTYAKTKSFRGTLTAGDLFVELATIRLCERWMELALDTDTKIKNLSSFLPPAFAQRIPWDTKSPNDGAQASMAKDAVWLEGLLEEKLMSYPWPWPVPGKDSASGASSSGGAVAEARQRP